MRDHPIMKSLRCGALAALITAVAASAVAVEIPETPDGTFNVVAQELAQRHPEILWHALPPSYQQDITELTHAFAARMPQTVWDSAFNLGRKAANLLRDKKSLILSSSMLESAGNNRQHLEDGWDPAVSVLDGFFSSDVARLEALKIIDWENYLETTGRDLMNRAAEASRASGDDAYDRDFAQKLKKTKIEVVSLEGDQATLLVTAPDEQPEELKLTRVEGRWVPSEMADDWEQNMADARQRLAALSDDEIQEKSMQAMMAIGMVDGMLTELESVETTEQLEQAIQGFLGPFLGGTTGGGFMAEPSSTDMAPETTDS